jgi:hypothetical protein
MVERFEYFKSADYPGKASLIFTRMARPWS